MKTEKILWLAVWVAIALIALAALSSCTTTKQVSKEKTSYDAQLQQRLIDSNRVLREESEKLQQDIKEAEYASAEFDSTKCPEIKIPSCPAMLNADSVNQLVSDLNAAITGLNNKVKFYADGSVEYSGRLKQFKYANERQQVTIQEKNRLVDSLTIALKEAKSNVKIEVREKTVEKKTTVFPWWFLLIAAAFAFLWLRKQFPNFLNYKSMKNLILFLAVSLLFASCGKMADGTSVWAEGGWLIPWISGLASVFFFYLAWKQHNSNSWRYQNGKRIDNTGNIPYTSLGRFWFGVVLAIATIVIIIVFNAEK